MANYINANTVNIRTNMFSNNQSVVDVDLSNTAFTDNSMVNTFYNCQSLQTVTNINDNVTTMYGTFQYCYNLVNAPVIPNSVTNMQSTFSGCNNLVNAPVIPDSVTDINSTFHGCHNLVNAPIIPNSVNDMRYTFYGCYNLVNAPEIPNSVRDLNYAFEFCKSLVNAPTIPNSITNMIDTFRQCHELVNVPELPNSLKRMWSTFSGCNSLITAPNIPDSVEEIPSIFSYCTNLTGNIYIISNQIINATDSFSNSVLTKNVYIPYKYTNNEYTTTYNSFINAGYDELGTSCGVYLKDINANTVPIAINIINGTGDVTIAGNTYTTNGTYNIPVGEQMVTVAGTASTQFYLSSGSAVQLAALGVNTCTLNFVSSSQVTTSYSGSAINISLPLSLIWWNKDK